MTLIDKAGKLIDDLGLCERCDYSAAGPLLRNQFQCSYTKRLC